MRSLNRKELDSGGRSKHMGSFPHPREVLCENAPTKKNVGDRDKRVVGQQEEEQEQDWEDEEE